MGDARKSKPTDPKELAPLATADATPVPISIDEVDDVETGEHRSASAKPPAQVVADDELAFGDELAFEVDADAVPRPIAPESRRDGPRSRTATLDDPFTTGLLAEVSRRTRPMEVAADAIREAEASGAVPADGGDRDDSEEHLADHDRTRRLRP